MIEINLSDIKMKNPFILASGVLGVTASVMTRIAQAGCGAITTKSIGPEPKAGYANPTVVELGNGSMINAMGFLLVAKTLAQGKPDAFELNVSCPHGGKYGATIGQDPALVEEITREVKKATKIPVYVKISPNLTDLKIPAEAAVNGGADGLVVINTVRAMAIDINYRKPILSNKFGGLSGTAIKTVALKCVYDMYTAFGNDLPIIGVGGIAKWEDVVEFVLAGAKAVQIGTAIAYCEDPINISLFTELADGLEKYLKKNKFQNLSEILGLAHE
ncbi:MAG: tRNA-dihydrouridine synthase [Candidatus Heimdallarchaeota archaeon]